MLLVSSATRMKTPSILCSSLSLLAALNLFTTAPSAPAQTGWGNALSFDGANDLVQIRQFGMIAPTTEITIEFWQNASNVRTQATFGLNVDMATNRLTAQVPWWDGQVHWYFGYTDSSSMLAYTPPVPITNSWQHFALVASQRGNFMRIYRNGVLEAQKLGMTPFVRGDYDLCLGNNGVNFFKGRLDEFRIWNVARSQAEIQAHMNHPLIGTESNLVASLAVRRTTVRKDDRRPLRFGKHGCFDQWPGLAEKKRPAPETLSAPGSVSGLARRSPDFRGCRAQHGVPTSQCHQFGGAVGANRQRPGGPGDERGGENHN